MSFPEAVEKLAGMAGVPMPARDEREEAREEARQSLYDVMEMATPVFRGGAGAQYRRAGARLSVRARGQRRRRRRGSASALRPTAATGSRSTSRPTASSAQEMVDTGLVASREDDPLTYDRFRNRVMFPITDFRGRIIAFGGRALSRGRAGQISQLARDRALPEAARRSTTARTRARRRATASR